MRRPALLTQRQLEPPSGWCSRQNFSTPPLDFRSSAAKVAPIVSEISADAIIASNVRFIVSLRFKFKACYAYNFGSLDLKIEAGW